MNATPMYVVYPPESFGKTRSAAVDYTPTADDLDEGPASLSGWTLADGPRPPRIGGGARRPAAPIPSRELPALGTRTWKRHYPSLTEILGADRVAALGIEELATDPAEFEAAAMEETAVRLNDLKDRQAAEMPLDSNGQPHAQWAAIPLDTPPWQLEKQADAFLKAAGFPVGTDGRQKDADGRWLPSFDENIAPEKYRAPYRFDGPDEVDEDPWVSEVERQVWGSEQHSMPEKEVLADAVSSAGLSPREAQLADLIVRGVVMPAPKANGKATVLNRWTTEAAELLGVKPSTVRTMWARVEAKLLQHRYPNVDLADGARVPLLRGNEGSASGREGRGVPRRLLTGEHGSAGVVPVLPATVSYFEPGTYPRKPRGCTAPPSLCTCNHSEVMSVMTPEQAAYRASRRKPIEGDSDWKYSASLVGGYTPDEGVGRFDTGDWTVDRNPGRPNYRD